MRRRCVECAERVKAAGASFLRGGAFKPRTSPYSFQGLEAEGLKLLLEAKRQTGLPIVTEIMSEKHLDLFADVDIIQLGARNMQNFMLLKELGRSKKPILLKRGLSATMEEFLMAAEYIFAGGNTNVILCERGIRTFEKLIAIIWISPLFRWLRCSATCRSSSTRPTQQAAVIWCSRCPAQPSLPVPTA